MEEQTASGRGTNQGQEHVRNVTKRYMRLRTVTHACSDVTQASSPSAETINIELNLSLIHYSDACR